MSADPLPGTEESNCNNCAHAGAPLAMLLLRCGNQESEFAGGPVPADGYCPCWAKKGDQP